MHTHSKNVAFAKTEYYLRSKYSGLELAENYAAAGTWMKWVEIYAIMQLALANKFFWVWSSQYAW
jgi:hypothetical protein